MIDFLLQLATHILAVFILLIFWEAVYHVMGLIGDYFDDMTPGQRVRAVLAAIIILAFFLR